MNWLANLCNTYDNHANEILKKDDRGCFLMPIAHSMQTMHIECRVNNQAEMVSATVVDKKGSLTLIPCTTDSSSRTRNKEPHPLFDRLYYMAKDLSSFSKSGKCYYDIYHDNLKRWCDSQYSHPKIKILLEYLEKGTLVKDLVDHSVLILDDNGKLMDKWIGEGDKPEIFRVLNSSQSDAFLRFCIGSAEDDDYEIWNSLELANLFINYYLSTMDRKNICYISGREIPCTDKTPSKIRNSADMAKLISSNDSEGFTYRGRFMKPEDYMTIGYVTSQKAINALKWLIEKQGKRYANDFVVLAWGNAKLDAPSPLLDSYDLLSFINQNQNQNFPSTYEAYAENLNIALSGYMKKEPLSICDDVSIIALDSATTGRLSVVYYESRKGIQLLNRINKWHRNCSWIGIEKILNDGFKENGAPKYKKIYYTGTPSPMDIIYAAYGIHVKENTIKKIISDLLSCILGGRAVPRYIVENAYQRTLKKTYDMSNIKQRRITCALIRSYLNGLSKVKEEYILGLDLNNKSNDYLCGRLLAYVHEIEAYTMYLGDRSASARRETNAMKYMTLFQKYPERTWYTLRKRLLPYQKKLGKYNPKLCKLLLDEMMEIASELDYESFNDKQLHKKFLLAFDSQMNEFNRRREEIKKEREGIKNDTQQ